MSGSSTPTCSRSASRIETAVSAIKQGAYDFIKKPFKADAIRLIVRLALETQSLRREVRHLRREGKGKDLPGPADMIGSSPQLLQIYRQVREVAKHETATVLITGESGTGKELVARAIHRQGPRRDKPFVAVNPAAIAESLMESELFGHEKGAFTSAITSRVGRFERAQDGTIFLDEIGDMSMAMQVKLLRVLQEREIERVGGTHAIKIDVRIVAATNLDLKRAVATGAFREDLFYRLNVVPITVPPLRERIEDLPLLVDHFIRRYNHECNKLIEALTPDALAVLASYSWPGNVRELQNIVERAVLVCDSSVIHGHHLPPTLQTAEATGTVTSLSLEEAVGAYEKDLILDALKTTRGNRAKAAVLLQSTERIIRYKVKAYGIDCSRFRKS